MSLFRIRQLAPLLSVVLFAAAAWALFGALDGHDIDDVMTQLVSVSPKQIAVAIALTATSYLMLTGYEALAMRHVGHRLPYPKLALASFVSYVFAHNVGVSLLSGGAVRYRIYTAEGIRSVDIALVTLLCTINFALGSTLIVALALLIEPPDILAGIVLPLPLLRGAGIVCVAAIVGYLAWTSTRRQPIQVREWKLQPPHLGFSLAQIVLSVLDIAAAAGVLFVLSPLPDAGVSFLTFIGVFTLAIVAGVLSHVPGGLGVFETLIIILLPEQPPGTMLAALIAYRCIYYVIPLLLGGLMLAAFEASAYREQLRRFSVAVSGMVSRFVPSVLSLLTLVTGTVLLVSGATPGVDARLDLLRRILPLQVVEGSHLLGSLTGLLLLLLARGLAQRLDAAYHLTQVMLSAGIVFSLLKGLDYEEAILLACVLAVLMVCRREFYRRSSILSVEFNGVWLATLAVLIGGSIWLGFFSYRELEYSHDLWWEFAFDADAPRFLRATFLVCIAGVAIAAYRLLRPVRPLPSVPNTADWQKIYQIVAASRATEASLALLGDKRFLFSANGQAFVMYGVQGSSWIMCGQPVGDTNEWPELLWSFREMVDRHGGRAILYQAGEPILPICIDLGLSLFKIGEEGRVRLANFTLEGGNNKDLRYTIRRGQRDGLSFRVADKQEVPALLPDLQRVSDAWLGDKNKTEKAFSLGAFIPHYLVHFPCALVLLNDKIIAFANLWCGAENEECSIDLMRYVPEAPKGVMDYLFIELLLWGRAQGYSWFNLGMAPLSGLRNHPLAPLWNRIGTLIFRNGEHFYNFEGLRRYKEKFQPHWRPRYLACPGGLTIAPALIDVSTLIAKRPLGRPPESPETAT